MTRYLYRASTYIKHDGVSKFVDLTSKKENTNAPSQGNGRNRHVMGRELTIRARLLDRIDETHREGQLPSNDPSKVL